MVSLGLQLQLDQKEIGKFLKKWKTANDLVRGSKKVVPAVKQFVNVRLHQH